MCCYLALVVFQFYIFFHINIYIFTYLSLVQDGWDVFLGFQFLRFLDFLHFSDAHPWTFIWECISIFWMTEYHDHGIQAWSQLSHKWRYLWDQRCDILSISKSSHHNNDCIGQPWNQPTYNIHQGYSATFDLNMPFSVVNDRTAFFLVRPNQNQNRNYLTEPEHRTRTEPFIIISPYKNRFISSIYCFSVIKNYTKPIFP